MDIVLLGAEMVGVKNGGKGANIKRCGICRLRNDGNEAQNGVLYVGHQAMGRFRGWRKMVPPVARKLLRQQHQNRDKQ